MDKADADYWDSLWSSHSLRPAVNPRLPGLRNYVDRQFDAFFRRVFAGLDTGGMRLLEIGCGNSGWLPYFGSVFDFTVCGLDYSEIGCEQEQQILAREGITGDVVCADMFSPPQDMLGAFDVVVSFGVAEHFQDTDDCIKAIARFAKFGGLVITNIPNMVGSVGLLQQFLNRPVYDIHVLVDEDRLREAHESAGCNVVECGYFLSTSFGVCNLNGVDIYSLRGFPKKVLLAALVRISMLAWLTTLPATRAFSPYINCVARKHP